MTATLTEVQVIGSSTGALSLPLGGSSPGNEPIQLRDIQGLGPVNAEITTVPSNKNEDLFQNARIGKRNILMKFGLNPDWIDQSMAVLRFRLYDHFFPTAYRTLRFLSDDPPSGEFNLPTVQINGYAESITDNIFSSDPEVTVSIICPAPNFIGLDGMTSWVGL